MSEKQTNCPDCAGRISDTSSEVDRRRFLQTAGAATVAVGATPLFAVAKDNKGGSDPESVVKHLFESLSAKQKEEICFDWDYQDPKRKLLRTRVANNWQVTRPVINTDFYTDDQRRMIRDIFEGVIQPEWHDRMDKQLEDDAGGFGEHQSIAIFGQPGAGKFEFVMTGRHMTLRCDGNSADHVAFGGPIFYGHAAEGFHEKADHPGNVFWPQAVAANEVYKMLDGKQQKLALVTGRVPRESQAGFRGKDGKFDGIPATELSSDQKAQLQKVLHKLIEPYRQSDRDEALACLKAQGGLDACSLAFYKQRDIGGDGVWDIWRLEGPAFVWHFRGAPHVHCWVNVASDPSVKLNA